MEVTTNEASIVATFDDKTSSSSSEDEEQNMAQSVEKLEKTDVRDIDTVVPTPKKKPSIS